LELNEEETIKQKKYNQIMTYFYTPKEKPEPEPTYREINELL